MPKPGQRSITVPERIYRIAQKQAFDDEKSLARWVSDLILEKVREIKGVNYAKELIE